MSGLRVTEARLSCGHTVTVEQEPPARADGWYAALRCAQCARKRAVVSMLWTSA